MDTITLRAARVYFIPTGSDQTSADRTRPHLRQGGGKAANDFIPLARRSIDAQTRLNLGEPALRPEPATSQL
jgi:hypothetical protein